MSFNSKTVNIQTVLKKLCYMFPTDSGFVNIEKFKGTLNFVSDKNGMALTCNGQSLIRLEPFNFVDSNAYKPTKADISYKDIHHFELNDAITVQEQNNAYVLLGSEETSRVKRVTASVTGEWPRYLSEVIMYLAGLDEDKDYTVYNNILISNSDEELEVSSYLNLVVFKTLVSNWDEMVSQFKVSSGLKEDMDAETMLANYLVDLILVNGILGIGRSECTNSPLVALTDLDYNFSGILQESSELVQDEEMVSDGLVLSETSTDVNQYSCLETMNKMLSDMSAKYFGFKSLLEFSKSVNNKKLVASVMQLVSKTERNLVAPLIIASTICLNNQELFIFNNNIEESIVKFAKKYYNYVYQANSTLFELYEKKIVEFNQFNIFSDKIEKSIIDSSKYEFTPIFIKPDLIYKTHQQNADTISDDVIEGILSAIENIRNNTVLEGASESSIGDNLNKYLTNYIMLGYSTSIQFYSNFTSKINKKFGNVATVYFDNRIVQEFQELKRQESTKAVYKDINKSLIGRYGVKSILDISLNLYPDISFDEYKLLDRLFKDKETIDLLRGKELYTGIETLPTKYKSLEIIFTGAILRIKNRIYKAVTGISEYEVYSCISKIQIVDMISRLHSTWDSVYKEESQSLNSTELESLESNDILDKFFVPDHTKVYTTWSARNRKAAIFQSTRVSNVAENILVGICFYTYLRYWISQGIKVINVDSSFYNSRAYIFRLTDMHREILAICQRNFGICVLGCPASELYHSNILKVDDVNSASKYKLYDMMYDNTEIMEYAGVPGKFYISVDRKAELSRYDMKDKLSSVIKSAIAYLPKDIGNSGFSFTKDINIFGLKIPYIEGLVTRNKDSYYTAPKTPEEVVKDKKSMYRFKIGIDSDLTVDTTTLVEFDKAKQDNFDVAPNIFTSSILSKLNETIQTNSDGRVIGISDIKELIEFDYDTRIKGMSSPEIEDVVAQIVVGGFRLYCILYTRKIGSIKQDGTGYELLPEQKHEIIYKASKDLEVLLNYISYLISNQQLIDVLAAAGQSGQAAMANFVKTFGGKFKSYLGTTSIENVQEPVQGLASIVKLDVEERNRFLSSLKALFIFLSKNVKMISSSNLSHTNFINQISEYFKARSEDLLAYSSNSTEKYPFKTIVQDSKHNGSFQVFDELFKMYIRASVDSKTIEEVSAQLEESMHKGLGRTSEFSDNADVGKKVFKYIPLTSDDYVKAIDIIGEDNVDDVFYVMKPKNNMYVDPVGPIMNNLLMSELKISKYSDDLLDSELAFWKSVYMDSKNKLISSTYTTETEDKILSRTTFEDFEAYINAVCRLIDQLCLSYSDFTTLRDLNVFTYSRFSIDINEFGTPFILDESVKYIGYIKQNLHLSEELFYLYEYGFSTISEDMDTCMAVPLSMLEDNGAIEVGYSGEHSIDEYVDGDSKRICDAWYSYETGEPCTFASKILEIAKANKNSYWSNIYNSFESDNDQKFQELIERIVKASNTDAKMMLGSVDFDNGNKSKVGYHFGKLLNATSSLLESNSDRVKSTGFYSELDDIETLIAIVRVASDIPVNERVTTCGTITLGDTYSDIQKVIFGAASSNKLVEEYCNSAVLACSKCSPMFSEGSCISGDSIANKYLTAEFDSDMLDIIGSHKFLLLLGLCNRKNVMSNKTISRNLIDMTSNHNRDWLKRLSYKNLIESRDVQLETYGYRNVPYSLNPLNIYGGIKSRLGGMVMLPVELFQHRKIM